MADHDADNYLACERDDDPAALERRAQNTQSAVSEVTRLAAEGISFIDASCMVISWFVVNHLDDEMGDDGLALADRLNLQGVVQELIRAVFVGEGHLVN